MNDDDHTQNDIYHRDIIDTQGATDEIATEKTTALFNTKSLKIIDANDTDSFQNAVLSPIYRQLIEMGYDHELASKASIASPWNIINAINI